MNKNLDNEICSDVFEESKLSTALAVGSLVYGKEEGKRNPGNPVLSLGYLRNKHLDSPFGQSYYLYKPEKAMIAGHIFLQRRRYLNKNVPSEIFLASDLISKSSKPFGGLMLFKKAVFISKEVDQPLINLSNKESSTIYSSFLDMKPVIQLEFRASITNLNSMFLRRRQKVSSQKFRVFGKLVEKLFRRELQFKLVEKYGEEIDNFLERELSVIELIGERNSKILNWRFHPSNEQKYAKFEVFNSDQFIGYFVFNLTRHNGKNIIILMDFFLENPTRKIGSAALKAVSREFPEAKLILIALNMKSNSASKVFRANTLKVPKIFVPQELPFYITESQKSIAHLFPSSHLTLFDTDIL
jgi:hypothetical protein